jgi:hypothetical protein
VAPSEPYAFAVVPGGSLWIADRWKRRIVHYSVAGQYLGEVPIALDQGRYDLHDLIALGDEVVACNVDVFGYLNRLSADGQVHSLHVTSDGKAIALESLYATRLGLVADTTGYSDSIVGAGPQEGPFGYVRIDLRSGVATTLPGLPIGRSSYFSLDGTGAGADFVARYVGPTGAVAQPLKVRYTRDGRHFVPFTGGPGEFTVVGDDVLSLVQLSAALPQNDRDGGRWLLRLGRSPLLWERLPTPQDGFDDSVQWRHLSVGPDGSIYFMLETRKGVEILRRP